MIFFFFNSEYVLNGNHLDNRIEFKKKKEFHSGCIGGFHCQEEKIEGVSAYFCLCCSGPQLPRLLPKKDPPLGACLRLLLIPAVYEPDTNPPALELRYWDIVVIVVILAQSSPGSRPPRSPSLSR